MPYILFENRSKDAHKTNLYLSGLPTGRYKVEGAGKSVSEIEVTDNKLVSIVLHLGDQQDYAISLNKIL